MIGTWFIEGVAFGFKAFFAALTFVTCSAIVTWLLGLVAGLLGLLFGRGNNDEDLGGD